MGSTIRRFVLFAIVLVFLVLTIYLMVGGDSSTIDRYDSLVAKNDDSKIEFDKRKKYFVVNDDGSVTLTYGYSTVEEQEEVEEKVQQVTDELNPQWDINGKYVLLNESKHMYQFKQNQYSDTQISYTDVATGGCGWCSLTSAYNILKGADLTPENFHTEFDPSRWGETCMVWSAPANLASDIAGIKYGSHYEGSSDATDGDTKSSMEILQQLRDLQKAGKKAVCILSVNGGMFNGGGGHIILCYKADDNGFYIINSVDMSNKIGSTYEEAPAHCYPYGTEENGIRYAIKCAWILEEGD